MIMHIDRMRMAESMMLDSLMRFQLSEVSEFRRSMALGIVHILLVMVHGRTPANLIAPVRFGGAPDELATKAPGDMDASKSASENANTPSEEPLIADEEYDDQNADFELERSSWARAATQMSKHVDSQEMNNVPNCYSTPLDMPPAQNADLCLHILVDLAGATRLGS
jgi:hypothetical protein